MSTHVLKKIYNITVYTVGICVLLAATMATLVRILLPDVGMYRSEVEAWVSNYMELPVVIRTINAEWDGWTPHLYLEQIDLLNSAGTTPIINFEKAEISIDILGSLIHRQIMPRELIISGFDITVSRLNNGSFNIAGMEVDSTPGGQAGDNELAEWLLGQNLIELRDIRLQWLDMLHDQSPINLTGMNLVLKSEDNNLQLDGAADLPAEYGSDMEFAIDVEGDILSPEWSAEVKLKANNIVPDNWYRQYWPEQLSVTDGMASTEVWSNWLNSRLTALRGQLGFSNLNIQADPEHGLYINELASFFSASRDNNDNWKLEVQLRKLVTDSGSWPETDIAINFDKISSTRNISVVYDYINIHDLISLLSAMPGMDDVTLEKIYRYKPTGALTDGRISYTPGSGLPGDFMFDTGFRNLSTPGKLQPVLQSISGRLAGTLTSGKITFDGNELILARQEEHDTSLQPLLLNGDIEWQKTDNQLALKTSGMRFENRYMNGVIRADVEKQDEATQLGIDLVLNGPDINEIFPYMPYTSRFRAREWLERSIPSGQLVEFNLQMNGNPADFPFDSGNGLFSASARVKDAVLDYSPSFPSISGIAGDINFQGREMQIDVNEGIIFDADIDHATAIVPDLFHIKKIINIEGLIKGTSADLKSYIVNSPLGNDAMLAKVSDSLSGQGVIELDLGLVVPLKDPDRELEVDGRLKIDKGTIHSDLNGLELSALEGNVNFTRHSLTTQSLRARLGNQVVNLDIYADKDASAIPATVSISGNTDANFIHQQVETYFPGLTALTTGLKQYLSGAAKWDATISYHREAGTPILQRRLEINSDLIGMEVGLPSPLGKKVYETVPFALSRDLDRNLDASLDIRYGDIATRFRPKTEQYSGNISVLLDLDVAEHSHAPGINVAGTIEHLDLDAWQKLYSSNPPTQQQSASQPVHANIVIRQLDIMGQNINDLTLVAGRKDRDWHVQLGSENITGNIDVMIMPDDSRHIIANLDHLSLSRGNDAPDKGKSFSPKGIPSLLGHVSSFKYDGMDLGKLELTAVPTPIGLLIEDISFDKPGLSIKANGNWNTNRYTGSASNFHIQVHADEFSHLLETFGFDNATIKKSETTLAIDANWTGSPMNFSLAKLNGKINLDMRRGQLLNIQPSAGRLFGLLSLQTLPRRLILDFSDLFGTGMAFDSIRGNFDINDGNAYTDNLAMKGPSVDIEIAGRTGLSDKDYDQTATITPQISDSLAVASGFLGPVGIGLGTVLYLAGNMFEPLSDSINKIMKFEYSIKGSWDDPVVEKTPPPKRS